MSFSVTKSRPFRSLGLYRSSGKHAAPRGGIQWPPRPAAGAEAHRPAHAASVPRPAEPADDSVQEKAADPEAAASGPAGA
ncbi:MAG TPA: hypothetical protein VFE26_03500 [Trebonia sp.]|nr:hypothetical protein [Trebonia sp.]